MQKRRSNSKNTALNLWKSFPQPSAPKCKKDLTKSSDNRAAMQLLHDEGCARSLPFRVICTSQKRWRPNEWLSELLIRSFSHFGADGCGNDCHNFNEVFFEFWCLVCILGWMDSEMICWTLMRYFVAFWVWMDSIANCVDEYFGVYFAFWGGWLRKWFSQV